MIKRLCSGRVQVPRLLRTANFRLTAFYASSLSLSMLSMFVIVAWLTTRYMKRQIDGTVSNEITEVLNDSAGDDLDRLAATVRQMTHTAIGVDYLLQDVQGRFVAGNMPPMTPRAGLVLLPHAPPTLSRRMGGIRGRGVMLPGGAWLFIGVSDAQLGEMQQVIASGFLAGLGITITLALLSGLGTSWHLLRRIEGISRTSQEIMAGDLGRRIALRGTDDEFDHLATSLNQMLDRIGLLLGNLQQISNDIAHDLRTPLSRMRQRLELSLHRERTVPGLQAAMTASIADCDSILSSFSALLRLAQIESGTRRGGFRLVALSALLSDLAEIYLPVAEEAGQHLLCAVAPGLTIRGDPELLTQALSNLIENAIRHAGRGACVRLEGGGRPDGVWVVVSDDGPGIPEAYRMRVMQRFFRMEASRSTPGQGLGLSLVQAVADLHGATVRLEDNQPGLRCVLRFAPAQVRTVASKVRPK